MILDVDAIRKDFPILDQEVFDHPLVYLDNGASAMQAQPVTDALVDYVSHHHSNVHRGAHSLSGRATDLYEAARDKVQHFINATYREEIIFTSGTTQSLNFVAQMMKDQILQEGDEVLISVMEHHSNLIPWQQACQATGAKLRYIPLKDNQTLDLEAGLAMVNEKTKVLSLVHASNVLGTVNPVKALADKVHDQGGYVIGDGAQATPHMAVDVQALDVDFYAFSGHKMCGPTGIGVLYGKKAVLDQFEPVFFGGEMINHVNFEDSIWKELPYKFEAGTPNIAGAIGLGAAVDYLTGIGMDRIQAYEQSLVEYVLPKILSIDGVTVYGSQESDQHTGVIAFNIDGVHPHDLATVFDTNGVAVRAGHHCTEPLMGLLDTRSTARASFYFYNTKEEADQLITAIQKTKEFFNHE